MILIKEQRLYSSQIWFITMAFFIPTVKKKKLRSSLGEDVAT